jgi:hypothetical protein
MNKILLRTGGAINLLFVLFHLGMVQPIGAALASLSPDIRATVSTLNVQMAFALLIFGYLALFRWRDLLTTRLGHVIAIAISLFWFLRAINQLVFYGLTPAGVPLISLCVAFGLLHLIPVLRESKNVPGEAQPPAKSQPEAVDNAPKWIRSTRWASYAAVAWCVVFGGLHLYWALGGTAGFAEYSMPSNRELALTRAPVYMGITWGVVIACVVAAMFALAPFQRWARRLPRWMLITPLWIVSGLFLVRGLGNPIQSALTIAGGMPFEVLAGPEAQAWYRWLLIDAMFFSPWFVLGGLAFGATAWSAGLQGMGAGGQ